MAQHSYDPHHPPSPAHPVDEKPAARRLVPAALQHIAAMYAGVVTPPLIIGQAVGLDTAGRTRTRVRPPECRRAGALNLFFHHLGTRSSPRAAVLSAASSGSGTQIP